MGGMKSLTIQEAAAQTGMLERRIRRWAEQLGFLRTGRDWHLTAAQVERIRVAADRGKRTYQRRVGQIVAKAEKAQR